MTESELRAPICCVLGHVDAGKTSLLDRLRTSHVADGEAGGITQQIGATYFPLDILNKVIQPVKNKLRVQTDIPGILILDTPGHASFANLRDRGSSICDMAIVVIDLFSGVQPQTKESLMLLKKSKTPFIMAVNKIDRVYGWESYPDKSISQAIESQSEDVRSQIDKHIYQIMTEMAHESLNCQLYYNNQDHKKCVNMVPVSAKSGDGIPDLLALIMQLTQKMMGKSLHVQSKLRAVVMEVKKTEGHGTTLDLILVDGELKVGNQIVVCGLNGPIITHIRALLEPHSLQELRVKGEYNSVQSVTASQCLKVAAAGLDEAVAGTNLYVIDDYDDQQLKECSEEVQAELKDLDKYFTNPRGVYLKASTLGSLQALHSFMTEKNIPISHMGIGPITHLDIIKAGTLVTRSSLYGCILGFDLKFIDQDLISAAVKEGVEVFTNDVMYQLVDEYTRFYEKKMKTFMDGWSNHIVDPCELELKKEWIFRNNKPMILGCRVKCGKIRRGTPLISGTGLNLGVVSDIQVDGVSINETDEYGKYNFIHEGDECAISLTGNDAIVAGRHFLKIDDESAYSELSRRSIDALKEAKRKLSQEELRLVVRIKKILNIK